MATSVVCHHCQRKIDLNTAKPALPISFQITCLFCGMSDTYFSTEAYEEKWNYTCVFCSRNFHRKFPPPGNVTCPHCQSKLIIDYNGQVSVYLQGRLPPSQGNDTVVGGLLGAILGAAVAGPPGAALGALLGGALGASTSNMEAIEGWRN